MLIEMLWLTICGYKLLIYSTCRKFRIYICNSWIDTNHFAYNVHSWILAFAVGPLSPLHVSLRIRRQKRSRDLVISRPAAVLLLSVSIRVDPSICYAPTHSYSFGVHSTVLFKKYSHNLLSDRLLLHQLNNRRRRLHREFAAVCRDSWTPKHGPLHLLTRNCEHESRSCIEISLRYAEGFQLIVAKFSFRL